MATLTDLLAQVYLRIGLPETDGLITSTVVKGALNRALDRIETEQDWPWLQTAESIVTVAGQVEYDPPADWGRTLWLFLGSEDLRIVQRRDIQRIIGDTESVSRPRVYCTFAEKILLGPPPEGDLTVLHGYIRHEPTLVADSDAPLLPSRYDDYLVVLASIICGVRLKDQPLVGLLREEKAEILKGMKDDLRRTASFPQAQIRRDW